MARRRTRIIIETGWCKSCGICAAFCPVQALVVEPAQTARVADPDACTGCGLCERLCPDLAIELESLEATA